MKKYRIYRYVITWYNADGTRDCSVERFMNFIPNKWAKNRCREGETYKIERYPVR